MAGRYESHWGRQKAQLLDLQKFISLFFVSDSMRYHLLLYQSQWDTRQKKCWGFPLKHLETSRKGNTAKKSQGRVKWQRHLHLLVFITHGRISFSLLTEGDKKKQIISIFSPSLSRIWVFNNWSRRWIWPRKCIEDYELHIQHPYILVSLGQEREVEVCLNSLAGKHSYLWHLWFKQLCLSNCEYEHHWWLDISHLKKSSLWQLEKYLVWNSINLKYHGSLEEYSISI